MVKKEKPIKEVKTRYKVLDEDVAKLDIKEIRTDGETIYIYDLFDAAGACIAKDRYMVTTNDEERPFNKLTKEEEDAIDPTIAIEQTIVEGR